MVETLQEAQTKIYCQSLLNVKIEKKTEARGKVKASKVVDTSDDRGATVQIITVHDGLRQLAAVEIINTPSDALA